MVKGQQAALEARLQSLGGMPADVSGHMEDEAISSVLLSLYAVFSQATLGYAMLHVRAHRFFDGPKEGSTADLAEKHLKNYVQAVNVINQLVSDVVARELDESGEECRCQCPACGLGICLCAAHGTVTINKSWLDVVPPNAPGNIRVRTPRRDSVAARAGLRAGDVILAADGQEIHTLPELQAGIQKHKAGETIQLRVQRASVGVQDITLAP